MAPTGPDHAPRTAASQQDGAGGALVAVAVGTKRAASAHHLRNHPKNPTHDDTSSDDSDAQPHVSEYASSAKRSRLNVEGVRRGKWSPEEQAYADRLIHDFEAGILPLENGATLRAYLSKKLNCDPMRISKKFAGDKCLGKVCFIVCFDYSYIFENAHALVKYFQPAFLLKGVKNLRTITH
jgi:hypothetical protein